VACPPPQIYGNEFCLVQCHFQPAERCAESGVSHHAQAGCRPVRAARRPSRGIRSLSPADGETDLLSPASCRSGPLQLTSQSQSSERVVVLRSHCHPVRNGGPADGNHAYVLSTGQQRARTRAGTRTRADGQGRGKEKARVMALPSHMACPQLGKFGLYGCRNLSHTYKAIET